MRNSRFPRNDQARRDALANHWLKGAANELSRSEANAQEQHAIFDSPGVLMPDSPVPTIYEGVLASSGWTFGLNITNAFETWNATASRVTSEVGAGISSFGIAMVVGSLSRASDKRVVLGIGPSATYVASANVSITMTVARSGFTQRTIASEAMPLFTIEPFSLSYTGPTSLATGYVTGTTGVFGSMVFTLQNSAETFEASLPVATVCSLFVGIPVKPGSSFFSADRKSFTGTLVGTSTMPAAQIHPVWPINVSFTLRKAAFNPGTLGVFA